jgi:hypothetical protein
VNISVKRRMAGIAASTLLASAPLASVPLLAPAADAASPLMCRAHMGDATPRQYTYDRVYVRSAAFVHITKFARTNRTGHGSTNYYISSATAGYRVWVDVWLAKGVRRGHCRTSFVPHG